MGWVCFLTISLNHGPKAGQNFLVKTVFQWKTGFLTKWSSSWKVSAFCGKGWLFVEKLNLWELQFRCLMPLFSFMGWALQPDYIFHNALWPWDSPWDTTVVLQESRLWCIMQGVVCPETTAVEENGGLRHSNDSSHENLQWNFPIEILWLLSFCWKVKTFHWGWGHTFLTISLWYISLGLYNPTW